MSVASWITDRSADTRRTRPADLPGDDGHELCDAGFGSHVDLDRAIEVGGRLRDDAGRDGTEAGGGTEVDLLLQGPQLLGHLVQGDLVPRHLLELTAQPLVLALELVVVERAVPGVAERVDHGIGGRLDRSEHRAGTVAHTVHDAHPLEVEGEEGDRRQRQDDDRGA